MKIATNLFLSDFTVGLSLLYINFVKFLHNLVSTGSIGWSLFLVILTLKFKSSSICTLGFNYVNLNPSANTIYVDTLQAVWVLGFVLLLLFACLFFKFAVVFHYCTILSGEVYFELNFARLYVLPHLSCFVHCRSS